MLAVTILKMVVKW